MSNIRIVMHRHGRGEIFVDDVKVPGVFEIGMTAGVDQTNNVTIKVRAEKVDVSGVFDVTTIESVCREFRTVRESESEEA